jgi:hypothetical protein
MYQFEQLFRQAVLGQFTERVQRLHGVGNDHDGVVHSSLHHHCFSIRWFGFDVTAPIFCHIGGVSFVIAMTRHDMGM